MSFFSVFYLGAEGGARPITIITTLAGALREGGAWWEREGLQPRMGRIAVWEFPELGGIGRWAADFDGVSWHTHDRYDA